MRDLSTFLIVVVLAVVAFGCTTRIYQRSGGDSEVTIKTSTSVAPASAVGTNPTASTESSRIETQR